MYWISRKNRRRQRIYKLSLPEKTINNNSITRDKKNVSNDLQKNHSQEHELKDNFKENIKQMEQKMYLLSKL